MAYDPDQPPPKPSQAPSWVLMGFVLGALCVVAVSKVRPPGKASAGADDGQVAATVSQAPAPKPAPGRFQGVEAVFYEWSKYAVWDHDTTEISVYDPDLKRYAECYEVIRAGDEYYFRTIPALTRPILTHGVPANSPLQFTETVESRARWLRDVNEENKRAFSEAFGSASQTKPSAQPR